MPNYNILIALDDGHGMETPGKRTPPIVELDGRVIHENEFNRAVVGFMQEDLERCGFNTLLVAGSDDDIPLSTRVSIANNNGASTYCAIHYNAFDSSFDGADPSGIEIFHYPNASNSQHLAEIIHSYLIQGTEQIDRGVKSADFYVLRETDMVAILSENGFMDNKREAILMIDEAFQREVAEEHTKGLCEYFGVPFVPKQVTPSFKFVDVADGKYLIVSAMNGKALDLSVTDMRYVLWQVHGGQNQIHEYKNGSLYNMQSGNVLDIAGASTNDGVPAIAYAYHGNPNQRVRFADTGDGYLYIVMEHSNKVLDIFGGSNNNGAGICQYSAHGGLNQLWKLIRVV